jgi:hypothetical protein
MNRLVRIAAQPQSQTHAHRSSTRAQAAEHAAHGGIEAQTGPGAVVEAGIAAGSELLAAAAIAFHKVAGVIGNRRGECQRAQVMAARYVGGRHAILREAEVAFQRGAAA